MPLPQSRTRSQLPLPQQRPSASCWKDCNGEQQRQRFWPTARSSAGCGAMGENTELAWRIGPIRQAPETLSAECMWEHQAVTHVVDSYQPSSSKERTESNASTVHETRPSQNPQDAWDVQLWVLSNVAPLLGREPAKCSTNELTGKGGGCGCTGARMLISVPLNAAEEGSPTNASRARDATAWTPATPTPPHTHTSLLLSTRPVPQRRCRASGVGSKADGRDSRICIVFTSSTAHPEPLLEQSNGCARCMIPPPPHTHTHTHTHTSLLLLSLPVPHRWCYGLQRRYRGGLARLRPASDSHPLAAAVANPQQPQAVLQLAGPTTRLTGGPSRAQKSQIHPNA
jgi:hypothetical protein